MGDFPQPQQKFAENWNFLITVNFYPVKEGVKNIRVMVLRPLRIIWVCKHSDLTFERKQIS